MEMISQIIRMLYRIRFWFVFVPLGTTLLAIYGTRNLERIFEVNTTLYTGVASGFTIESGVEAGRIDWASVNNGMDNLVSIIKSKATLREVSMRLYVQHMIYGDSLQDNNYIRAENYRALQRITPNEVKALIDTSSLEKTIENLNRYEKASPLNFVYGLFNWNHHHYSFKALDKIDVKRIFESDMLEIKYSANDPGIAYNTLVILIEESVRQYKQLRFGETNNVVEYFRQSLRELEVKLRNSEDSLTKYYLEKRVINYEEQTKQVAALTTDYSLLYNDALLRYASSNASVIELEKKIREQTKLIENNSVFLSTMEKVSELSNAIARMEILKKDSLSIYSSELKNYREKLADEESSLKKLSENIGTQRYSTEGIATRRFVDQWVEEVIEREKAFAEIEVMEEAMQELDSQYVYFSPIGSTLKRMERNIDFTERSYLSVLQSLNAALMRQKTLQMTSATIRPLNPPLFPVAPIPTARRAIVLATFVGTIILLLGIFIIVEIFDRTIRDNIRAERLILAKVLGVFPRKGGIRYRNYAKEYERIAVNYLANSIVSYLNPMERPDIINFISTESGTGKSSLISLLQDYWTERGLKVRVISWHDNYMVRTREYIMSNNLSEIYDYENEDIVLVEHRALRYSAIPVGLLREASLNLVTVRADLVWRDIDKIAFNRLKEHVSGAPLMLYLTRARRDVSESFLGLLPPYSKYRKLMYKLIQFGLTSN